MNDILPCMGHPVHLSTICCYFDIHATLSRLRQKNVLFLSVKYFTVVIFLPLLLALYGLYLDFVLK